MSNTRRIVLLITILLLLAFPVRTVASHPADCYGGNAFSQVDVGTYCDGAAGRARGQAATQLLLITVGGIAAWVLIPGKKPDPE